VEQIQNYLPSSHVIDIFDTSDGPAINVYYEQYNRKEQTVLLSCHHDIVNKDSDNCLDNNASIYNLLLISYYLKNPRYNLIYAFVDKEERGGAGIIRAAQMHDFDIHIDLELTAFGRDIAYDRYGGAPKISGMIDYRLPNNNSEMLYRHQKAQKQSYKGYCVTMLNSGEVPKHWRYIHTLKDEESLANHDQMASFRQRLIGLLSHPDSFS
jgi:hypothetical protein